MHTYTGTYSQDCGMAYSCPACRSDQKLSLQCSGGGSSVPVSCLPCLANCPSGAYCVLNVLFLREIMSLLKEV